MSAMVGLPMKVATLRRLWSFGSVSSDKVLSSMSSTGSRIEKSVRPKPGRRSVESDVSGAATAGGWASTRLTAHLA